MKLARKINLDLVTKNFAKLYSLLPATSTCISGNDSPALICDDSGKIISLASTKKNAIDIPVVEVLRQAARFLDSSDLMNKGLHLFVLGDMQGNFEGMGAVNNFAPSNVHIWKNPELQVAFKPANNHYSREVSKNRNIRIFKYHKISADKSCRIESLASLESKEDPHKAELNDLYRNLIKKYHTFNFGFAKLPNQNHKNLLSDLHELAVKNVKLNGGPFAAAVIDPDGKLISVGTNRVFVTSDPLMHGEVSALSNALEAVSPKNLNGYTLITTSQTCIGCAETCARLGIKNIFFGNTARQVEENTCFSEGPLNPDFFGNYGILQLQIDSGSDFRAFELFAEMGKKYMGKSE